MVDIQLAGFPSPRTDHKFPCYSRECDGFTWWADSRECGVWVQHGDNPEHRRFFSSPPQAEATSPVVEWLMALHNRTTDQE